jgi:CPA1 family monovalent cation:H+ antiporter
MPFVAYLPADALGLSGVLSTLSAGLVVGQQPAAALQPARRIRVTEFWEVLVFLLESALFVLVGLQLRRILGGIGVLPRQRCGGGP